jgi:hypothetical protein
MLNLKLGDLLAVGSALLCFVIFIVILARLFAIRRRDISMRSFILGAPLWFFAPRRYFPDGKQWTPWRLLLAWSIVVVIITALAQMIPIWLLWLQS